jgi:heavy metal sensor kinase
VKRWSQPRSLRSRLTWWYVTIMGAVLVTYLCGATLLFSWHLTSQMTHHAIQDLDNAEELLYFLPSGAVAIRDTYPSPPGFKFPIERFMEVRTPDGAILYQNALLHGRTLGGKPTGPELAPGYFHRSFALSDGTRVAMVSRTHMMQGKPVVVRIAYGMEAIERRVGDLIAVLFAALPIALAAAAYGGYRVVGKALEPLQDMASRAQQITASRLDERLPVGNPDDELGSLAGDFNQLLERLEESFQQLRRFTSDVSHELRTPLAAMRCVGESGLRQPASADNFREIIGSMLEEVNRLTQMTETLLTISRADAGQLQLQKSDFSIAELVREAVSLIAILAEEKGQDLDFEVRQDMVVHADRLFLHQAVVNLLHNAVKYSPPGGGIRVSVSERRFSAKEESEAVIEFADSGPGIPTEDQAKIFNRFHRVDKTRSTESGGVGLGLAIAKWAVEANGGHIGLEQGDNHGCRFFIRLPATAVVAAAMH